MCWLLDDGMQKTTNFDITCEEGAQQSNAAGTQNVFIDFRKEIMVSVQREASIR